MALETPDLFSYGTATAIAVNSGALLWITWRVSSWWTQFQHVRRELEEHKQVCEARARQAQDSAIAFGRLEAILGGLNREVEAMRTEIKDFRDSVFVQAMNMSVRDLKNHKP